MSKSYHVTNSLSSGGYSDISDRKIPDSVNPYAIIPPVGRLLDRLCTELSVGGCIRPGNRQIAAWLGLSSAGSIPGLLTQLVSDGWISYDRESGIITLLRDMRAPKQPKRPRRPVLSEREYQAQYRARNRATLLAKSRAYAATHRIERAASHHATLARRRGDQSAWTADQWRALCDWFGNVCLCCGATDLTVDHVISTKRGGSNGIANLQPLCKPCNLAKRDKTIDYRDQDRLAAFLESISESIACDLDDRSIDHADRVLAHQDAADLDDRSPKPTESACMVLAAASTYKSYSGSAAALGGMQGGDHGADHRAVLLAELGADAKIIADALANRPDLTPEQIRASWSHFEPRIRAGLCTSGAFFAAIRRGQLHAPPDKQRPLDPESYADDPAYQLGSAPPDEAAARNARYRDAHWRAVDLLGPGAAFGDMRIVVEALVDGATDDQALAELARELSETRR